MVEQPDGTPGELPRPPAGHHVLLVGLPGVGKSTVGRRASRRLGVGFVDLDREIELLAGATIPEIFEFAGEPHFRDLERRATAALRGRPAALIATGGGWAANPGAIELSRPPGRIIHLAATPASLVARVSSRRRRRPLLAGGDALGRLEELLRRRADAYARADGVVDTEGIESQEVTAQVSELARRFWWA